MLFVLISVPMNVEPILSACLYISAVHFQLAWLIEFSSLFSQKLFHSLLGVLLRKHTCMPKFSVAVLHSNIHLCTAWVTRIQIEPLDISQCKCYLKIVFLHALLFLCRDGGGSWLFLLLRLGKHYWSDFSKIDYYVSVAHLFFSQIASGRAGIFKRSEFWIQSSG